MMFGGITKDILLSRLQDEVNYLRSQNQKLLDQLLLLTDRNAFAEAKHADRQEKEQLIQLERFRGMTKDQIQEEKEKERKENEIVAIQLRQMMTGGG